MTRYSVPDMSCSHCHASVTAALSPIATRLEIDLPAREIAVEGPAPATVIATLAEIGFPAHPLP